jgi:hypothetical protein
MTITGFTTAKIEYVNADLVCARGMVFMTDNILAGKGLRIIDTSVPVIPKCPADTGRLVVIIILW